MMKPKVLVTFPIEEDLIRKLREFAEVKLNPTQSFTRDQLRRELADIDAIILGADEEECLPDKYFQGSCSGQASAV